MEIDHVPLETGSSFKLLGVVIQNNLQWDQQVHRLVSNASRRLCILSKLKKNGVEADYLLLIDKMYILPMLEFGAPVWSSGITVAKAQCIECIQKRALRMIAFPNILSYGELLNTFNVVSLSDGQNFITMCFAHFEAAS